jgi:hypothetical protein
MPQERRDHLINVGLILKRDPAGRLLVDILAPAVHQVAVHNLLAIVWVRRESLADHAAELDREYLAHRQFPMLAIFFFLFSTPRTGLWVQKTYDSTHGVQHRGNGVYR